MDSMDPLLLQEREAFRQNMSALMDDPEHFFRCWRQQRCDLCVNEPECSWCPFVRASKMRYCLYVLYTLLISNQTWACVPNKYPVQLLAPAYDEQICPHWAERWEIRTQPFGCQVSTITTLSTATAIASTLAVLLVLNILVLLCRCAVRGMSRHKAWRRRHRQVDVYERFIGTESEPLIREDGRETGVTQRAGEA